MFIRFYRVFIGFSKVFIGFWGLYGLLLRNCSEANVALLQERTHELGEEVGPNTLSPKSLARV